MDQFKVSLKDWADKEQKYLETLEALNDVDDSKIVSHEEVEQWFAGIHCRNT